MQRQKERERETGVQDLRPAPQRTSRGAWRRSRAHSSTTLPTLADCSFAPIFGQPPSFRPVAIRIPAAFTAAIVPQIMFGAAQHAEQRGRREEKPKSLPSPPPFCGAQPKQAHAAHPRKSVKAGIAYTNWKRRHSRNPKHEGRRENALKLGTPKALWSHLTKPIPKTSYKG